LFSGHGKGFPLRVNKVACRFVYRLEFVRQDSISSMISLPCRKIGRLAGQAAQRYIFKNTILHFSLNTEISLQQPL
jgi:hypothetical protein